MFYTEELLQRRPLDEISIINNTKFSLIEKTSVKLLPILNTLRRRMANEEEIAISLDQSQEKRGENNEKSKNKGNKTVTSDDPDADMKNILGYLN